MEQISKSHSLGEINNNDNNLSSSTDSLQDKKDYIEFNISNFFKHYKVEDKIKKLSADCILISQIRDTVENLLYLEFPELKHITTPKPKQPPKTTRHPINNSSLKKKTVSKSPTQKQHSTTRSHFSQMNTFSKGKSLSSFRAHSSAKSDISNSFMSNTMSSWSTSKGLTGTNIKKPINQKSLILHARNKTSITTSSTSLNKKVMSTTPDKKETIVKRNVNKNTLTPNKTRNYKTNTSHLKNNTTVDIGKGKGRNRNEVKKNGMKIGNFKDEDNRAISPISIGGKSRKQGVNNKKKSNLKGNTSIDNSNHKKEINSSIKKNAKIFNTIKPKEIALNTSTEVVDNNSAITNTEKETNNISIPSKQIHRPSIQFTNSHIQALYLSITSGFISPTLKAITIQSVPELYRNYPKKSLLKELLNYYEAKVANNAALISKYDLRGIMIQFTPSKKAQNGLNFVTKEEEKYLLRKEQTSEITNLFILILILLNEPVPVITSSKDFLNNFFTSIYPKYNVITMKNLFMDCIILKLPSMNITTVETFMNYIASHPNILDRSVILGINQSISYMTYILNEIYSYLSLQTQDGVYYYIIRAKFEENTFLNDKISKLNSYLSS